MFTGIVQGTGRVSAVERQDGLFALTVDLGPLAEGVQRGASVSIAGVCLTAVRFDGSQVGFDLMGETLEKTTLGDLKIGDRVNVERSAKVGDEIGGHLVSGHVAGTVAILNVQQQPGTHAVTFATPPDLRPYLLPKGFVALDGCSLTIVDVGPDTFSVHLIPETLERTTFGTKGKDDQVNVEIDSHTRAIVDTIRRLHPSV